MKTITKFGLAALAAGALWAGVLPSKAGFVWISPSTHLPADTPDPSNPFTKHGLPVPGVYFKAKENQQATTIAVSKTGQGVGEGKQPVSKVEKKRTPAHSSISESQRILHGPRR
jgi:hypothetical protein